VPKGLRTWETAALRRASSTPRLLRLRRAAEAQGTNHNPVPAVSRARGSMLEVGLRRGRGGCFDPGYIPYSNREWNPHLGRLDLASLRASWPFLYHRTDCRSPLEQRKRSQEGGFGGESGVEDGQSVRWLARVVNRQDRPTGATTSEKAPSSESARKPRETFRGQSNGGGNCSHKQKVSTSGRGVRTLWMSAGVAFSALDAE